MRMGGKPPEHNLGHEGAKPAAVGAAQPAGFSPLESPPAWSPGEREALAARKAALWFSRRPAPPGLRHALLLRTMQLARREGTCRTMIIMPISAPIRRLLFANVSRGDLVSRWGAIAQLRALTQ